LHSLYKYLLPGIPPPSICWKDINTFFQSFIVSAAVSKLGKTDLDQELQ